MFNRWELKKIFFWQYLIGRNMLEYTENLFLRQFDTIWLKKIYFVEK